ncbi:PIN domain-containing protein [Candidatus Woesearchaeota archaeon]|nr:PIN domain-containing protein [Candidatus Woesearchaeota archaeon]
MIADSSFLIALFIEEDGNHENAIIDFSNVGDNIILIPDRVLEETFTVVTYKKGILYTIGVLERIRLNKKCVIYHLSASEQEAIIALINKLKIRISFIDYCVAYLTIAKDEELLCYDKEIISFKKKYESML